MIIVEFLSTWAPVLVSVLGILTTVILAIGSVKDALCQLAEERKTANAAAQDAIKSNTACQTDINRLTRDVELLLDQITRIKDFAEVSKNDQNK